MLFHHSDTVCIPHSVSAEGCKGLPVTQHCLEAATLCVCVLLCTCSTSAHDGAAATVLMESLLDAMCGSSTSSDSSAAGLATQQAEAGGTAAASGSGGGGGGAGGRALLQLSSLLYGTFFKRAVEASSKTERGASGEGWTCQWPCCDFAIVKKTRDR